MKNNFAAAYAALGAAVCAIAVATFAVYQAGAQPDVKKAVAEVAGSQNLVALCEASITQQVQQSYGTVQGYANPRVSQHGDKATVKVTLRSDVYTGRVACSFDRSNWQLSNVQAG